MNKNNQNTIKNQSQESAGIKVDSLTKKYKTEEGSETVFENLSFNINSGDFVTLIGRSGSGKSTTLNIISQILEPTSGTVEFVDAEGKKKETTLGHVFQEPHLLPWKTARENIEFVHKNNPNYSDEIAENVLDMVGLADHYDKYPSKLSGGQNQRVGIARALSVDPDVLLMDEPFSSLDEITAEEMRGEMGRLHMDLGKTVFVVTHDLAEAVQLSDRILMLGDGHIYDDIKVPFDRPRNMGSDEIGEFNAEVVRRFNDL